MRLSKAALEAEGWRPRAPETPEPPKPEPIREPEGPSMADVLAPVLAELSEALRTKSQPVVVTTEAKTQHVKGIKVIRNKDGLIDRFELIY